MSQNRNLSSSEAGRRAWALMDGNTDAQLRKYIRKNRGKRRKEKHVFEI